MPSKRIPEGLQIAPSLLSADFARLAEEISQVEDAGVRILHLDVMDGHFVPNITFGPPLVGAVRRVSRGFLDVHLMISNPLPFLAPFAEAGADLLTVHAEALAEPHDPAGLEQAAARLAEARAILGPSGTLLGLTFRPASDPQPWLERLGGEIDLALLMTVEPGFGGQAFMADMLPRVAAARDLRRKRGWHYRLEVDGGVGIATIGACAAAGAEIFVAGSAVFGAEDRPAVIRALGARAAVAAERISTPDPR